MAAGLPPNSLEVNASTWYRGNRIPQFYDALLDSAATAFIEDKLVEDGEHLFAVVIELSEIVAEVAFVLATRFPLF